MRSGCSASSKPLQAPVAPRIRNESNASRGCRARHGFVHRTAQAACKTCRNRLMPKGLLHVVTARHAVDNRGMPGPWPPWQAVSPRGRAGWRLPYRAVTQGYAQNMWITLWEKRLDPRRHRLGSDLLGDLAKTVMVVTAGCMQRFLTKRYSACEIDRPDSGHAMTASQPRLGRRTI